MTRASSSTRSTASASSCRASASISFASRRSAAFSPGCGFSRVHLSAWRKSAKASRATLRACRASGCFSARMSSARARSSGTTRAGWPSRTGSSPAASSFSSRLSTAWLLGAQASTVSPRATAWRMNSTTVVVLPVPGGPWMIATSFAARANVDGGELGRIQCQANPDRQEPRCHSDVGGRCHLLPSPAAAPGRFCQDS